MRTDGGFVKAVSRRRTGLDRVVGVGLAWKGAEGMGEETGWRARLKRVGTCPTGMTRRRTWEIRAERWHEPR